MSTICLCLTITYIFTFYRSCIYAQSYRLYIMYIIIKYEDGYINLRLHLIGCSSTVVKHN